jgi:anaerobic selenocysteine-containing dehydrogenase
MKEQEKTASRRGMLFGAAAVGTAAAAIATLPKVAPQEAAQETVKPAPEKGGGYHLTAHIKQYYSTTLI